MENSSLRKNQSIFLKQTYNKDIQMKQNSLQFRVISPNQLLSNQQFSPVHINGYRNHINNDDSLFRSTMDDEFYAPVRKKSIEVFKDEEEETVQFDILGKNEELLQDDNHNFEVLGEKQKPIKMKETKIDKNHENPFSKKTIDYKQKQHSKKQIKMQQNLETKDLPKWKQQKKHRKSIVKILIINKQRHIQIEHLLVHINLSILQEIFFQFQQQQFFIPILNSKQFNQDNQQNQQIQNTALEIYFQYVNQVYPKQFCQFMKKYNEKKQTNIIHHQQQSLANISLKKIGEMMNTIVKSFGYNSSKIILLEKTLLSRARTLKQMKQHLKQIIGLQFFQQQYNTLQQQQEIVWYNISNIELLLCLEDSQKYCNQKIKQSESTQKALWTRHRNAIKKQLARKLIQIDYSCI